MTIKTATPYIILNGRAERAIALYQSALGARTETLQRFGEVNMSCPDAMRNNIMHAQLRLGDAVIMLSDGPGEGPLVSGNVAIALDITDEDEARRSFAALATSGKVIQPLFDAPWGALFGVVEDELGVHWMFNSAKRPAS